MTESLVNSPAPSAVQPEMLSVSEVAKIARVSASTVRNWIATGRLVAHRYADRLIRIRRTDLDFFIEHSKTGGDHN